MEETHGLVIVHTGNGKGKTTAALGMAIRAWGQGRRVLILQFIKGGWKYGELKALEKFAPEVAIRQMGEGFVGKSQGEDREKHRMAARETLSLAQAEMLSGKWDLLILDEVNYAVKFGLLSVEEVLAVVAEKPAGLHMVLTGRAAAPELIERADLVTEMKEIKHPYQQGIPAQAGIEF